LLPTVIFRNLDWVVPQLAHRQPGSIRHLPASYKPVYKTPSLFLAYSYHRVKPGAAASNPVWQTKNDKQE